MSSKLNGLSLALRSIKLSAQPTPSFLLPFNCCQVRSASILSTLSDTPGSYGHKKRVGRGPSSGKGKTAGRGYNGQKQRSKTPYRQSLGRHFEGGQTPVEIQQGSHGFVNNFSPKLQYVNLEKIASWIAQNRIDPTRPITVRELLQSRCVSRPKEGITLLATGKELLPSHPLRIITSRASAAAIAAVESKGGMVATRYYTPFAFRRIMEGKMDPVHSLQSRFDEGEWGPKLELKNQCRLPDPTARKVLEYYRDPAHRGYLSWTVPEGHSPSLFFKAPGTKTEDQKSVSEKKIKETENRLF